MEGKVRSLALAVGLGDSMVSTMSDRREEILRGE